MRTQIAWRHVLAVSAGLTALIAGTCARAQVTARASDATRSQGGQDHEIIITATRLAQTLGKVPESISAFTAAKMEAEGVKSFADLVRFTPGVAYEADSHDVAIRGIQSTAGASTTGVYIDDTPIQTRDLSFDAYNALPAVFDLDRVEVLRGPQGTLFGAGAEGGVVRYITPQPSLIRASGYAHAELAGAAVGGLSYEVGAAVGGPIVEGRLGFRVSAWGRRDGGWIDRVDDQTLAVIERNANRVDTGVVRIALAWAPITGLIITPAVNAQQRSQYNYDNFWVALSNPGAGRLRTGTPERMANNDRFVLPSLKIEYHAAGLIFTANTAYFDRMNHVNAYSGTLYNLSYFQQLTGAGLDPQLSACAICAGDPSPLLLSTGRNLPGFGNYVARNLTTNQQQNFTQEFRLQSSDPDAKTTWVAGLFLGFNAQRGVEEINDPQLPALTQYLWGENMLSAWGQDLLPNGDSFISNTLARDRQIAVFFETGLSLTDRLKLTMGARYAWTHFDFTNTSDGAQNLFDNGGVAHATSGGKNEAPFTPKVGLTFQITPQDMIYATATEGYRIGGATPPLPASACGGSFPTTYNSDTVDSLEIGTKDAWLDRRLQVAASAYLIHWKDIQQAVYVPACGLQYTTNLSDAVSQGFDIQAQWRVRPGLQLELSAGYNDAHYSADAVASTGDVLAKRGDSLGGAPWTLSVGAQYNFSLLDHEAWVRVDDAFAARRTAAIPAEDARTDGYDPGLRPNPSTNQLSARASINLGRWTMELFANNLLDQRPRLDLNHQDQLTQLFEAATLRPRTIGLAISSRY